MKLILASTDCMLDLETLDSKHSAAVVSIGAVFFDQVKLGDMFYAVLDLDSQTGKGRTTSSGTLDWWAQQSEEARKVFDEPKTQVRKALLDFSRWLGSETKVWGNGVDFDNVILRSLYESYDLTCPWKYTASRCFRTLKALCKGMTPPRENVHHNALDDAVYQAKCAQVFLNAGLR